MRPLLAALLLLCLLPGMALARPLPTVTPVKQHAINGYGYWKITCYFATGQLTATGTVARYGELAVDPHVIPLGSHVHIEGIGTFRAEDTGGLVIGRHLDVFVTTWPQAYYIQGNGYRKAYWW